MVVLRKCKSCGLTKDQDLFSRSSRKGSQKTTYGRCRECTRLYKQALYRDRQSEIREKMVEWLYGLSRESYRALLEKTGNRCEICGSPPGDRNLAVDHDHKTGEIRGLLCTNCNVGLGRFKDGVEHLVKAIAYLERPRTAPDGVKRVYRAKD